MDTTIRLEYVPTVVPKGLAIEIRIGKISYAGDAANSDHSMTNSTTKKVAFDDVSVYSDEFSFQRHFSPERDVASSDDEATTMSSSTPRRPASSWAARSSSSKAR